MSIRSNKARAERLAGEVDALRLARREHLARARDIFGRRLGSPAGLAVCFGAGAVAGLRLGRQSGRRPAYRVDGGSGDGREAGFLASASDSPVGNIVIRLAAATLVRYLLTPSAHGNAHGDGAEAGEEVTDGLAGS